MLQVVSLAKSMYCALSLECESSIRMREICLLNMRVSVQFTKLSYIASELNYSLTCWFKVSHCWKYLI